MKKSLTFALFAAAFLAGGSLCPVTTTALWAQTTRPAAKTNDSYIIVQIGDDDPKAIRAADLQNEKKKINDDYKTAMAKWHDDVQSDKKAPRPKKPQLKTIKKGFKTQAGANEYIDTLKDKPATGGDKTKPQSGF